MTIKIGVNDGENLTFDATVEASGDYNNIAEKRRLLLTF